MLDLSDKGSQSEEMNSHTPTPDRSEAADGKVVKTCVDCGTSKTPLWRGGPAGPKSLCNACGIRSRKKRRALMGVNKEERKSKKSSSSSTSRKNILNINGSGNANECSSTSSSGDSTSNTSKRLGVPSSLKKKMKLWAFGRDVALQRPRSNTTQRRKLGEVEQAAVLLMALSCGSVYA